MADETAAAPAAAAATDAAPAAAAEAVKAPASIVSAATAPEAAPPDGQQAEAKPADADGKPEAKADDKPAEPAPLEVKLPEGFEAKPETIDAFKAALTDADLTPQQRADKLVELYTQALTESQQAAYKQWADLQAAWQKDVDADPELGGANFTTVKANIAKAINEIAGDKAAAVREAFDMTGAGNNPEIIRLFSRMAFRLTEGKLVHGGKPATPDAKSPGSVLYPDTPVLGNTTNHSSQ